MTSPKETPDFVKMARRVYYAAEYESYIEPNPVVKILREAYRLGQEDFRARAYTDLMCHAASLDDESKADASTESSYAGYGASQRYGCARRLLDLPIEKAEKNDA